MDAEQQLLAAEEALARGDDAYDLLQTVQLGALDDPERTTRLYLSLVRLHRRHSSLRTAASARLPAPEPEPELRTTTPYGTLPCVNVDDAASESIGSVASFQNVVHPCELETTSNFTRRDSEASSQDFSATAPDPLSGAVGGKATAGLQVIPRLQLGESLQCHDVSSGPRTRSSRRLSARISLESTRGTPNNTGRSLRSVRLQVQDDIIRPPSVGFKVQQGSGYTPSASRQLQLLAARAAGVFVARRSAGMSRNIREKHAPTAWQTKQGRTQRETRHNWVNWRSQHCIVDLMIAVATEVLDNGRSAGRCVLDMDVVQLPINALVADLMSTAHHTEFETDEWTVPATYRAAVLRLCGQISSIVDICSLANDAAANGALGPDAPFALREPHPNRTAVLTVLPGGTASDDTPHMQPATAVSAKPGRGARGERAVLRLARMLTALAYADTLELRRIPCCLSLLTEYIKLRPDHRAPHIFGLIKKPLRKVSERTVEGREFDARIHLSYVEIVHCLLALSDLMPEPSTDWLVMERTTANWIGAYCCWILTANVGLSECSYSVGQMQSQALLYITRCARAWCQGNVDKMPSRGGAAKEVSEMIVCPLISMALSQDHTASIKTGSERAEAVLKLVAEVALPGRQLHCDLQDSLPSAMYCACTIFLRAYFQPAQAKENDTLCCMAISMILRLLEVDATCVVEQIERLRLVDIIVGEISGEHLFDRKKNGLNFTLSSNEHIGAYGDVAFDSAANKSNEYAVGRTDEGYRSDSSDSLDSRYSGDQDDSYSCSEDFTLTASTKAPMPSLQLSGITAGPPASDASDVVVDPAEGAGDSDLPEPLFLDGRRIYGSEELHLLVIQLIMALVVTSDGLLSPDHWSRTPAAEGKPNLHDLLYDHLNHARNRHLIPELEKRIQSMPSREGGLCLLRLICADMFDTSRYTDRTRLASGANATVYRCNLVSKPAHGSPTLEPQVVALKVIDRSSSANHFCPLPDVFSEIRVLMRLRGCEGACQLIDYGVGSDSYYIVLKCYTTSLRKWRLHQDTRSDIQPHHEQELLPLYLRIFRRILLVTDKLATRNIIHFDIKCDNVLMSPSENGDLVDFWNPTSTAMPQHDVVLADFGVGKLVGQSGGMHTVRNRGTECIKSPEMILADRLVTTVPHHSCIDRG